MTFFTYKILRGGEGGGGSRILPPRTSSDMLTLRFPPIESSRNKKRNKTQCIKKHNVSLSTRFTTITTGMSIQEPRRLGGGVAVSRRGARNTMKCTKSFQLNNC